MYCLLWCPFKRESVVGGMSCVCVSHSLAMPLVVRSVKGKTIDQALLAPVHHSAALCGFCQHRTVGPVLLL